MTVVELRAERRVRFPQRRASRLVLAFLALLAVAAPMGVIASAGAAVNGADTRTVGLTSWSSGSGAREYSDSPVELGVKFQPRVDGTIVGVRFLKTSRNTGTHVGNLWSASGARLATATFTSETATGWQAVRFASPVAVTAGKTYTASYRSPTGRYAATQQYFASSVSTRYLRAPGGANGVYRYGSGSAVPTNSYASSSYWVDVMFEPSVEPAPTTTVTPAPTAVAPAPAPTTSAPTTAAPAPTTSAPAPTTAAPAPTTSAPAPTTAAPAPTTASPAPTTASPAPTNTSGPTATPVPTGATLPPGVVPLAGQVGYRGAASALRVIDSAASAPAGTRWEGGMLIVSGDNVTLDGVLVRGGLDYYGRGTLTVRNSVIEGGAAWLVLMGRTSGCTIDIRDSTLRWKAGATPPIGAGAGAIHGYCTLKAYRNDISGTPDGIQLDHGNSIIEQNYIHDLAVLGNYPNNTHNDGVQFYGGSGIQVRHNNISIGWNGTNQNGALFFQGSFDGPLIEGNRLSGGGFTLRLESGVRNAQVRNNTILRATNAWGEVLVAPGTVGSWSGNVDGSGRTLGY